MRPMLAAAAITAALLSAIAVRADAIDHLNNNGNDTGGWWSTAQTFTVATSETLVSYAFIGGAAPSNVYGFEIYDWTTGGPALFAASPTWINGENDIRDIGLHLQARHVYAAEVDYLTFRSFGVKWGGDVYSGGNGLWSQSRAPNGDPSTFQNYPGLDTAFRVELAPAVPEPVSLALILAGLAVFVATGRLHGVRRGSR